MSKIMGNVNDESIINCYLEIWIILGTNNIEIGDIKDCLEKLLRKKKCKAEFFNKIKQAVYERGAGNIRAKFLLLMAELQCLKENTKDVSCFSDDSMEIIFDKLSVEHILYEGVDEDEVSKDFYASVHKLGNLTLLGSKLNSKEGAKKFIEKIPIYSASPYFITREVGKIKDWNYPNYIKRQEKLIGVLKRAFEL